MVSTQVTPNTTTTPAKSTSNSNSSTSTTDASKKLSQTYDQFLKLLTTQLKNQDPLSPMDSAQFTSQLVQFSSVEQQINTNSKLDSILQQNQASQTLQAASFLGTTVEAASNTMVTTDSTGAQFGYTFTNKPDTTTVSIYDKTGTKLIRTLTPTSTAGHNIVTWDGKDQNGVAQTPGDYKFSVSGSISGTAVQPTITTMLGKITDVQFSNSGATLYIGDVSFPLGYVTSVKKNS